jgi:hypothetical protein
MLNTKTIISSHFVQFHNFVLFNYSKFCSRILDSFKFRKFRTNSVKAKEKDLKVNIRHSISKCVCVCSALKHYTLSSDARQQGQVLRLLIQLVLLRVNYCLLDSDKVRKLDDFAIFCQ